ncbi:hypothetical protein DICVIV_07873 [Dictyocaulus viviparus]|uniref:Peptidase M13 N-terminal domain-containing protein n=1 Tax=Dictyocaulus viviparus TaxID=29172 RepID=A0A0D8XN37_DICVI|nr:hypothetical protein DICVIV_07873 [Dictyocaulus viviparus]
MLMFNSYNNKNTIQRTTNNRLVVLFVVLFIFGAIIAISILTILFAIRENLVTNSEKSPKSIERYQLNSSDTNQRISLCISEKCTQLASTYQKNMNRQMDPCTDFYSFTCGNYARHHIIPEYTTKINLLIEMRQNLGTRLKSILETLSRQNNTKSMQLVHIYYDSCMNVDAQNDLATQPLFKLISELGGWELLTNAQFDSEHYQWEVTAGQLALIGIDGLMRVFVHSSFEDRNIQTLMFCPPSLYLKNKKFYRGAPSSNVFLKHYKNYIKGFLQLLGVDIDDDSGVIDYQINDIIDLERRIANLSRSDNQRRHSLINNLMSYKNFRHRYREVDQFALIRIFWSTISIPTSSSTSSTTTVFVIRTLCLVAELKWFIIMLCSHSIWLSLSENSDSQISNC